MEKQISFSGVALTPYNDISPDGQLSACVNLEHHAGSLRPSALAGTEYQVPAAGLKLITIHATSGYRHMILYDGAGLYWADERTGTLDIKYIDTIENLKSVHAIGNTLSVLSDDGISYILFKNDGYISLGDIPEVSLSFALKGAGAYSETSTVSIETIPYSDINKDFSDNNKRVITDAVMILANDFIQKKHNEGMFVFPFLLRYAYRMYNGDLIKHSVPVLISCINERNIYAQTDIGRQDDISELIIQVIGCYFQLCYKASNSGKLFEDWSDIIKSIDIFISEPVYTYYPDKLCEKFENYGVGNLNYAICSIAPDTDINFTKHGFLDIFKSNNPDFSPLKQISMPYKDTAEITEVIEETSNFYFLTSIPCRELVADITSVNIDSNTLGSLVFKERMTDDYYSHDKLYADKAFVYNRRLILSNITKEVFKGQQLRSSLTYQDDLHDGYGVYTCYIYARINNKDVVFKIPGTVISSDLTIDYFFFPNPDAYQAVFVRDSTVLSIELKNHPLLNGVYYCSGFRKHIFFPGIVPQETGSRLVNMANVIYTSQVDNPFYFPVQGVNTVGTGEIIGLSSITTALSQGQFGSFPLMAFCTDGNYALQVDSEGLFSAVTPMQRDVCTNPKSITQIDGAIIFVTARGVMVADGSSIRPLSDILNGPHLDISRFAADDGLSDDMMIGIPSFEPVDFFQTCIIAYDYPNKRLLFMSDSSEDKAFGWQYSIDEQSWQQINFGNAVIVYNVFPSSYVQHTKYAESYITRLDRPYDYNASASNEGYILTRPLKLDSLQYKSLRQVALVGSFSQAQTVGIYGSNDGINWFRLGKSNAGRILIPGRYFKYYRFSVQTDLASSENVTGLRIEYDVRPERRLR